MYQLLLIVYVVIALVLVGLVLIQQGQGAGMGASFGSGASATVFGSSGSGNFLTRTTAVLATLFFALSLVLSAMSSNNHSKDSVWSDLSVSASETAPVDDQKPAADNSDTPDGTPAQDIPASDVPN